MPRYSDLDAYVDVETGVLKNLLGIRDQALLEASEADLVSIRSLELAISPISGGFDLEHLKKIHWHLFRDVYTWAGELRTVDISKGDNRFAHHAFLESAARPIFERLAAENYLAGLDADAFCVRTAYYLGELNALHPFRDGNGRTQREFLQLLARRSGYFFLWKKADRDELLRASIESFRGDTAGLRAILRAIICRRRWQRVSLATFRSGLEDRS
jgi:cell filamentation protein